MKKVIFSVIFCIMAFNAQAQIPETTETVDTKTQQVDQAKMNRMLELMGKKIEMEIDTELFIDQGRNNYVSEDPKALIMAMLVPETYENAKKKMINDAGGNMTITDKGEKEMNGVTVLYMIGTNQAEGSTLNAEMYCMEIDAETCLMFVGMADVNADAKYTKAISTAANSVIKKQ